MGCDIHLYKESMFGGEYRTADKGWVEHGEGLMDVPFGNRFTNRDYPLFSFLAEVRGHMDYSFAPRGVPFDCCSLIRNVLNYYVHDGHSHSYLYLFELKNAWKSLEKKTVLVKGMKNKIDLGILQESIDSDAETNWNLIYPYSKLTNNPESVEFSLDVPATFKLSRVKNLIDLFDDVDGDYPWIIFFFDN